MQLTTCRCMTATEATSLNCYRCGAPLGVDPPFGTAADPTAAPGDPVSAVFCHQIGLGCSPFRAETARLAAGQAVLGLAGSAST